MKVGISQISSSEYIMDQQPPPPGIINCTTTVPWFNIESFALSLSHVDGGPDATAIMEKY